MPKSKTKKTDAPRAPRSSAPDSALRIAHSAPGTKRWIGKIATLPKEHRQKINELLDNGATYKTVAAEMSKDGISLNGENISNWFNGGFQEYLSHQAWLAQQRALVEDGSDLIDGAQILKFHQAANLLATTQIFKALKSEQFNHDPMNYTRILNAFSRLSRGALTFKQYEDAAAQVQAANAAKAATRNPRRELEGGERDIWWDCVQGLFGFKPDRQIGPTLPDLMNPPRSRRGQPSEALAKEGDEADKPTDPESVPCPNTESHLPSVALAKEGASHNSPNSHPSHSDGAAESAPAPEVAHNPAPAAPAVQSSTFDVQSSKLVAPSEPHSDAPPIPEPSNSESLQPIAQQFTNHDSPITNHNSPSPSALLCPHCIAPLPRRLPNGCLPCTICPNCRELLPDDI